MTFTCGANPDDGWLSCAQNATHVNFVGTPNSNLFAKTYQIEVTIADIHSDVADHVWSDSFVITSNAPPTIGPLGSDTIKAPDGKTWDFPDNLVADPENLTVNKYLEVDGSTTVPSWLIYNLTDYTIGIITSSNSIAGTHNITLVADDTFNPVVKQTLTLTIEQNLAPERLKFINNESIINYKLLEIEFEPLTTLFRDPDDRPMTARVTQANGDPLPFFLSYNAVLNKLSGTPTVIHVGDWILAYSAVDDHGLVTDIVFKVVVKRK